jgi:hypothetical protein
MNVNQYDSEIMAAKIIDEKSKFNNFLPAVNTRSKRAASKRKFELDDYLDETSYSKTKKRSRNNGKTSSPTFFIIIIIII